MRQFREDLRERDYDVEYVEADTFGDGLETYFERYPDDELVQMRSPSHRSAETFEALVDDAGGSLEGVPNELFVGTRRAFDRWANETDKEPFRHETFYRWMRRQTGVLMTDDGDPVGGEWNYDDENQEFLPDDWESPPVYEPDHDGLTAGRARGDSLPMDTLTPSHTRANCTPRNPCRVNTLRCRCRGG